LLFSCFYLSLLITSTASNPALWANYLGITSRAFAKLKATIYSLPYIPKAYFLRCFEISISIAPAPGTTAVAFMHLFTTITASCKDLSASSINYSAPPLKIIVDDFDWKHVSKMLYLSAPIYFSSKNPQVPNDSGLIPFVVWFTVAPVALVTLFKSSSDTLPAQKISLSAKY